MDTRRVFKTPTNNSYASDYIKNKKSKVIFSGTSNLASTIVEQGGAFPLVTPQGQLKPYQGTFGFSSATPTQGAPPSSYCLNTARSYSDLLNITNGKYLLTPPNATTMTVTQLNDINFSSQLFCGNLYEKGKTGVNEIIIFNSSITGVTGATGATNKIIYNPATTANQWIKVDPSFNMLHNGSSCESEKSNVLTDVVIRRNIDAQRKLDRFLNLNVQGFKFPIKFSLDYEPEDCINANNDIQTVNNESSFISPFLTRTFADASPASVNEKYPEVEANKQDVVRFVEPTLNNFIFEPRNFNSGSFVLERPISNSPGAFSYTSSNRDVSTIIGNTVTIEEVCTTNITAKQEASGTIVEPFVVNEVAPMLYNFTIDSRNIGSEPFTLTPPTSNNIDGAFTYTSSNKDVATIIGNTVTIVGVGTTNITAIQAATKNYTNGTIVALFVVKPIPLILTDFTIDSRNVGSEPFTLNPPISNNINSTFSYSSSNINVATILGNIVTIVGVGTTYITATQLASGSYSYGTIVAPFVVTH